VPQAEALEKGLASRGRELTAALLIDVPDEEVIKRLSGRRICTKNQHVYHVDFNPPKNEGVCDMDGSKLIQRDDDKPETVKKRLEVYHEQTEPLIKWYEDKGLLRRFDGTRSPDEVNDHIRATLATLKLESEL
jgi:adenylate kinase